MVAKNKFLAAATRDMRQPVIAMGLYAEFLEAGPQSYNELAPKIGRAAQVVNQLFDSLFDLSAFDAGQVRLRRMIGNVLSNAIKYTQPGGKILLAVRPAGSTVRVEVWDQGTGLALIARLADALRTRIAIDSVVGRGRRVSLTLGSVEADASKQVQLAAAYG